MIGREILERDVLVIGTGAAERRPLTGRAALFVANTRRGSHARGSGMGSRCGTDFPPHTASRTVAGSLPRRDAMTSPTSASGRLRASRRRYAGPGGVSRSVWAYPLRAGRGRKGVRECTGGDDERQLQEAGHTPAARLGMTETAETQRVQTAASRPRDHAARPRGERRRRAPRRGRARRGPRGRRPDAVGHQARRHRGLHQRRRPRLSGGRGPDGPARVDRRTAACRSWSPTAGAASCRGPTARGSASACRSSPRWPSRSSSAPGAPRRPRCG